MNFMKSFFLIAVSCLFIGALSASIETCAKKNKPRMGACFKGAVPAANAKPTVAQSNCVRLVSASIKECIKGPQDGASIQSREVCVATRLKRISIRSIARNFLCLRRMCKSWYTSRTRLVIVTSGYVAYPIGVDETQSP